MSFLQPGGMDWIAILFIGHTHARTHANTRARTHARGRTRTRTKTTDIHACAFLPSYLYVFTNYKQSLSLHLETPLE